MDVGLVDWAWIGGLVDWWIWWIWWIGGFGGLVDWAWIGGFVYVLWTYTLYTLHSIAIKQHQAASSIKQAPCCDRSARSQQVTRLRGYRERRDSTVRSLPAALAQITPIWDQCLISRPEAQEMWRGSPFRRSRHCRAAAMQKDR
jgi:hypothetical protein